MSADSRRTMTPGERIVGHLPARPLDPLSTQIHRHYREHQDRLKARYARIKPEEPASTPGGTHAVPAQATPPTQGTPAMLTAEEEAEEAWLASLIAEYRASEAGGE